MVVARKLICDDGHVLYSRYNHDYQQHTDKNGKYYMLDGGLGPYYRTCGTGKVVEITTENNTWEEIREEFCRYNKYSRTWVKLKDISNPWLENILEYLELIGHIGKGYRLFLEEKIYRNEKEIYVKEYDQYQYTLDF